MSYYLILRNHTDHPNQWLEDANKVRRLLTEEFSLQCDEWEGNLHFSWVGDEDDEESYVELSYEFNADTGRHEIWSDNPTSSSAHIMYQIEQQLSDGTTLDAE